MADWARFCDFWAANFSPLRENDGLAVWREFVADPRTDERTLELALRPLAEAYSRAIEALQPARRPTLASVRKAYFDLIAARRRDRQTTNCGTCGGTRTLWMPCSKGPEWPPNYKFLSVEDFAGCELVPCPDCGEHNWGLERAHLVRSRGLPQYLAPDDPRIPDALAGCGRVAGDAVIRAVVLGHGGRR